MGSDEAPLRLDRGVHFAPQQPELLPWEVMLTDSEKDALEVAFEASVKNAKLPGGEAALLFSFQPSGKELYGSSVRREYIFPAQASARQQAMKTAKAAGTAAPKKRPSARPKVLPKPSASSSPVKPMPAGPPPVTGWKEAAQRVVDELAKRSTVMWNHVLNAQSNLPFYADIVCPSSHGAIRANPLNPEVIQMKLSITKDDVKTVEPGDKGYHHSMRWLTDIRTLFAQHFIYLNRVNGKDPSFENSLTPSADRPYPSHQELDLLEVDLRTMVQSFENLVTMSPSLQAHCLFEAEPAEKRVVPKKLPAYGESLVAPSQGGGYGNMPRGAKRRTPEVPVAPPPPAKKFVSEMIEKASQGDDWALDYMTQVPTGSPSKKAKADNLTAIKSSWGLKENAHIPIEPPSHSALDLPELPTVQPASAQLSGPNLERAKQKAHESFEELDVMYRFAILKYLSFDLGIHPTVCSTEITYLPDLDLLMPGQVFKYILSCRDLMAKQAKMTKLFCVPPTLASHNNKKSREAAALAALEPPPPKQIKSSASSVVGSLASIGGARTITAKPLPAAEASWNTPLDKPFEDSSSSVSSSISSSPPASPVQETLPGPADDPTSVDTLEEERLPIDDGLRIEAAEPEEEIEDIEAAMIGNRAERPSDQPSDRPSSRPSEPTSDVYRSEDVHLGFNSSEDIPRLASEEEEAAGEGAVDDSAEGAAWRRMKTDELHRAYQIKDQELKDMEREGQGI